MEEGFGTGSFSEACVGFTEEEKEGMKGNVVVVERGGCSFVSKARRVQAAGGVGLVVLDLRNVSPSLPASPSVQPSEEEGGGGGGGGGEGGGGGNGGGGEAATSAAAAAAAAAKNSVYSTWEMMGDDKTGGDISIPSTLLGGENAWLVFQKGYLPLPPFLLPLLPEAQKGEGGREGGRVLVRMGAEDMMALEEERELLDLTKLIGPAPKEGEGGREGLFWGGGGGGKKKLDDFLASLMENMKDMLIPQQQREFVVHLREEEGGREEGMEEEEEVEEEEGEEEEKEEEGGDAWLEGDEQEELEELLRAMAKDYDS